MPTLPVESVNNRSRMLASKVCRCLVPACLFSRELSNDIFRQVADISFIRDQWA